MNKEFDYEKTAKIKWYIRPILFFCRERCQENESGSITYKVLNGRIYVTEALFYIPEPELWAGNKLDLLMSYKDAPIGSMTSGGFIKTGEKWEKK